MTRRAFAVMIAVSAVLAGCDKIATGSEPTPTPSPTRIEGTYTLQSVNGVSLPARFSRGISSYQMFVSGSITLNTDGTFSTERVDRSYDDDWIQPRTDTLRSNGTFRQQGGVYWFRWPHSTQEVAAGIVNGELTLLYDGPYPKWVYKR